ncbi:MAG: hypothetical protein GY941_23955 [Planctomycetes bacterium]|nr:hypothetical protein [Planctomycetota bacterium]
MNLSLSNDKKSLPYEVFKYHISVFKKLLAKKSHANLEHINKKYHSIYFKNYFRELHAKTIIVENEYIDRDFLEDYAGYYVRCFHHYKRRCTRLHFFDIAFCSSDFKNLLTRCKGSLDKKTLNKAYLGFIVVKPLPQTIIGRTCLKTYKTKRTQRHFPVIRSYKVHLFGIPLEIESLSFQEQDSVAAACATSALWSVFHRTGTLFHHAIPSPLEITKSATSNLPIMTRILPNTGLDINQMANAIIGVGLEPFVINVKDNYVLKNTLYTYLRGRIPMIFGISLWDVSSENKRLVGNKPRGLHAVAITGYNLGLKKTIPYGKTGFLNTASRIDKIYVHDDQIGPFARMVFDNNQISLRGNDGSFIKFDSLSTSWQDGQDGNVRAIPQSILVPLYHKIRIPFSAILKEVVEFDVVFNYLREKGIFPLSQRQEWDIYLTTISDLKEELFNSTELNGNYLKGILVEDMPRFLWRATAICAGKKILDLLFDATDIEQGDHCVIAIEYESLISEILKNIFKIVPEEKFPAIRVIHKWFKEKTT